MRFIPIAVAAACGFLCATAAAQSVSLAGMFGSKALLIIDGGAPRGLAPGESLQGVRLLSTTGDEAVVEIGGKRHTLRVGSAPVSIGARGGAGRIVLHVDSDGHYVAQGAVNGRAVRFLLDTGASFVSMSVADAERIGINYKAGTPVRMNTANGVAQGWRVKLSSVKVGEVELFEIDAVVAPMGMPLLLLGNSYLNHFRIQRDNEQMMLERKY